MSFEYPKITMDILDELNKIHQMPIYDPDQEMIELHNQELNDPIFPIKRSKIIIIGTKKDMENDLYSFFE